MFVNMTGMWPDLGYGIYGLTRLVPIPSVVTHYLSTGPNWERDVTVTSPQGGAYATLYAPPTPVRGGTTTADTWFGGPFAMGVSPVLTKAFGWAVAPNRQGDAGTAALLDVVTFGIFEIITYKNHGWRHPGEYDRRRPKVVIAYDGRDVILGIFGENDAIPADGRSGPYGWLMLSSLDSPPAHRQSSTETVFAYDAPMIRQ
jgi:hypothetical protein